MTLDEIAKELNVSKSTVSRALSGKGRIGEETKNRIIAFMENADKKEQEVSTSSRTGNIGVVFPADTYITSKPYFHSCLIGMCEVANLMDYNIMLATATTTDISGIKKLVERSKVDGVILTRSLEHDIAVDYLLEKNIPVAMTGICNKKDVLQVDIDNGEAAETMTSLLIKKGFSKFALIIEDMNYHVNRSRQNGFYQAILKNGLDKNKQVIYTGGGKMELMDAIITDIMSKKVECVICGDDTICIHIVSSLQEKGYRIPKDIAVASLYNSSSLSSFTPSITTVNIDAIRVGNEIGKLMINRLQGRDCPSRMMLDYDILFRKSTNRV
ncbi:MAG: LacI family DNA-binding transcriptional regulator [Lachnospiraceae bacterium]|nr:LacI family DNA-binding transcriptional regulator [Lachnospiraceae bacterium]